MTANLNQVRAQKVARPTQEEIERALHKANINTRTSLCKMVFVQIVTR